MPPVRQLIRSPRAADRIGAARAWLEAIAPGSEVLVVEPGWGAADDLVRELAVDRGALFGIHRLSLNRLVGLLAAEDLAAARLVPASGLAAEAVAARAIHRLKAAGGLSYFEPIADRPGFPTAVARTLEELRLADVAPPRLRPFGRLGETLAALLAQFEAELADGALLDRAGMFRLALAAVGRTPPPRFVGLPTLLLDLPVASLCERELLAALALRTPALLATVPAGDGRNQAYLEAALGVGAERAGVAAGTDAGDSLARLQEYLFEESLPPERDLDNQSVTFMSAPGENRECVELARRVQALARRGVPFDRIAILLHAPEQYTPHLEEALRRGEIPAYFALGAVRPEPGGRALLTLLACAAEKLSARRFAEYLSLAQVPEDADGDASDGRGARAAGERSEFVPADLEMIPAALAADLEQAAALAPAQAPEPEPPPVIEGTLRAPWRWEQLLVDAAVIGSRERWQARLDGLEQEFKKRRQAVEDDDPRAAWLDRQLLDMTHLKAVALKQIAALAALPLSADWRQWLEHLRALVELAIRDREPVLAALAELEPMALVGPVDLDEVRLVLAERLGKLTIRPSRRRYGAVFVGPSALARGLVFDVVMVPGLAERIFPKKLTEDPILPDAERRLLGPELIVQKDRVAGERTALRLAVGAARRELVLSYPRLDLEQGRPRVPSFYTLEVLRAAEGRLPGFDELARRAASVRDLRLGWPAPKRPEEALDAAEFDLALLEKIVDADPEAMTGTANYLLSSAHSNPHLVRALRARGRRWWPRWSTADGLVDPEPAARSALARHQFAARAYSPTALQNFAACPYRFFLQAIHRLRPREEPEAIEVLDPLTRGALFHEVQFELLSRLKAAGCLPLGQHNLPLALGPVDEVLDQIAARYEDELAPAIARVWEEGIASIRADLREWLRRMAERGDGWCPERFELCFGLALSERAQADPSSRPEPVALDGGLQLRGSIDLVERDPARAVLRVTDHKSGKAWAPKDMTVGGGKVLQPLLYALAVEKLLAQPVESGRLYYCTLAGGYEERVVVLDEGARRAGDEVISVIGRALEAGFLPAAPARNECLRCDYRLVCGPYEEQRVERKQPSRIEPLARLRKMP